MNGKIRLSKYILVSKDEGDNIIMYNTLYATYVFVRKSNYNDLISLYNNIREGNACISNPYIQMLHDAKMVWFPDDNYEEENELLNTKYESAVNSKNSLNVIILPTEKCNFRCVYCYENFFNGKMKQNVVDKTKELIGSLLPQYKSLYISWFGGEPLLALDVISDISEYALKKCKCMKKPYYSYITTNGYLLTLDVVKELLKWHVMKFQVTIDGCEETHNSKRKLVNGDGTYRQIIENLIGIRDNIKTQTIKVIVRVNVTDENSMNEIESIKNIFCDDPRFVFNIQPVFGKNELEPNVTNSDSKYYELLKHCDDNEFGELTANEQICYAAKSNTIMVRSDGTIGKCTVNLDDPENNFGNVCAIHSKDYRPANFDYKKKIECNSQVCVDCCLYPICFGIQCPARYKQACAKIYKKCTAILAKTNCNMPILFE